MRTVDQHAAEIDRLVRPALAALGEEPLAVDAERVATAGSRALGRRLVRAVTAPVDLPPFANSQMDGYAVRSADVGDGASLVVAARVPAGTAPAPLVPGTAAPVMTGAPVPEGADAVVPIERVDPPEFWPDTAGVPGAPEVRVTVPGPLAPGTYVRPAGSDAHRGDLLVAAGARTTPARLGVLAAAGLTTVDVVRRPRVLLVSTGEELTAPGEPLAPGRIHDANGAALAGALAGVGVDVVTARVRDDATRLLRLLAAHAPDVDLVVTTGGVSAGAYEVVREALAPLGVAFGPVAVQPGGPQGWGVLALPGVPARPVVCLPGNPVSCVVSFEAFLRPVLQDATGVGAPRRRATATMAESADSPVGKHQLRRGTLDVDGRVHLVGGPGSHLLTALAEATVLVHLPVGVDRVDEGDEVVVWGLDD